MQVQTASSAIGPRSNGSAGVRAKWDNGLSGEMSYNHVGAATYPTAQSFTQLATIPSTGVTAPGNQVGSDSLLNLQGGYRLWQKAAVGYTRDAEAALSVLNALNDEHGDTRWATSSAGG